MFELRPFSCCQTMRRQADARTLSCSYRLRIALTLDLVGVKSCPCRKQYGPLSVNRHLPPIFAFSGHLNILASIIVRGKLGNLRFYMQVGPQ